MNAPLVTLLTDFGLRDGYVGVMKGVILTICSTARLVDLSHDIPPQGVTAAALVLRQAVPYFGAETVHLAVVDPRVGSTRAPIAVLTERGILVGPDNGLLAPAAGALGIREVRRLENRLFFRPEVSRTFHGRDVFAPVAAHLAAGVRPEDLGPRLARMEQLALAEARRTATGVEGEVVYVDHFGNLITNIDGPILGAGGRLATVELAGRNVPVVEAYAAVAPGEALAIINSWGCLEVAVRDGHAARVLGVGSGAAVRAVVQEGRQTAKGIPA